MRGQISYSAEMSLVKVHNLWSSYTNIISEVTSLRVLLAREKDEDAPKLNILLTESLVAVICQPADKCSGYI